MKTLSIIAALMLLVGCASIGSDFDINKAQQLQVGISTETDAEVLVGKPVAHKYDDTGKNIKYMWYYDHANDFGSQSKKLVIIFDQNGKMIRINEIQETN